MDESPKSIDAKSSAKQRQSGKDAGKTICEGQISLAKHNTSFRRVVLEKQGYIITKLIECC